MTTLDEFIKETHAHEQALREPTAFWKSKEQPYFQTAHAIAARVLRHARPEGMDAEEWSRKSAVILDRIVGQVLVFGLGMELAVTEPVAGASAKDSQVRPVSDGVSMNEIKRWIRAGQMGEPDGKRITPKDETYIRDRGIDALARIVQRAYYSRRQKSNYARLRVAIQRYLNLDETTSGSMVLDAIATAWEEHFSVRFARDFSRYVAGIFGGV